MTALLEPVGVLHGPAAAIARTAGLALPLAGGPAAFTHIRQGNRLLPAATLAASTDPAIVAAVARITSPRPPVCGLDWQRTAIMGILNVTPDSFSDGGAHNDAVRARWAAQDMVAAGADILDIGGESTRPGADTVPAEEETARVLPVLAAIAGTPVPVSLDTRKPQVMAAGAAAGAALWNDVSGLTFSADSLATAARLGLPIVIMHNRGDPKTMNDSPVYDDVVAEVFGWLAARIEAAESAGIPRARIIADPGIGFGKTMEHSLALLARLPAFHTLGVPLLIGASRKRIIGAIAGEADPARRLPGSLAIALHAVAAGVQIVRVHDVPETAQALAVWRAAATGA